VQENRLPVRPEPVEGPVLSLSKGCWFQETVHRQAHYERDTRGVGQRPAIRAPPFGSNASRHGFLRLHNFALAGFGFVSKLGTKRRPTRRDENPVSEEQVDFGEDLAAVESGL